MVSRLNPWRRSFRGAQIGLFLTRAHLSSLAASLALTAFIEGDIPAIDTLKIRERQFEMYKDDGKGLHKNYERVWFRIWSLESAWWNSVNTVATVHSLSLTGGITTAGALGRWREGVGRKSMLLIC